MIAVAAAEVGLKQCISRLVPETRWLIENIPSPPLLLMLRKYLPTIAPATINGKVLMPPRTILNAIEKGVEIRNKIVHGRSAPLDTETLFEILLAVRDLLYLLDIHCGFIWAQKNISAATMNALAGAVPPK